MEMVAEEIVRIRPSFAVISVLSEDDGSFEFRSDVPHEASVQSESFQSALISGVEEDRTSLFIRFGVDEVAETLFISKNRTFFFRITAI